LERQKQVLGFYCGQHGWTFELISDLGSGMNYYKKGLVTGELYQTKSSHGVEFLLHGGWFHLRLAPSPPQADTVSLTA
jgi:hypothetical protein